MATRPAWSLTDRAVICREFEFNWNGGFSITQKQKNIKALHWAIENSTKEPALEVSTKSLIPLGISMSAFSLKLNGIYLENIFQSSKKYELGGPYLDLLYATPKDAKQDERHVKSGSLISFVKDGVEWALEPKTAFYDYIYVSALMETFGQKLDLSVYNWFTDIEFNPKKSINCQARSVAIYKMLQQKSLFHVIKDRNTWLQFHEEYVNG
ncbi:MAG TPA: hypothetical protein P5543_11785 [Planctomycetota bacterium]|nr:hypothetical protein [Planctomycetota bacterium]